jgi:hypothetical protein
MVLVQEGMTDPEDWRYRLARRTGLPPRYAVDIDTLEQLELAEWLLARDTVTLVRPEARRRVA